MDAKSKFERKKKASSKKNKGLTSPKARAKKKKALAKKKKTQEQKRRGRNKKHLPERSEKKKGFALCTYLKVLFGKQDPILFDPGVMDIVEMLNFTQTELRQIKYAFEKVDIDHGGEIDYDEFMELIRFERSPFTDALLSLVDPDGTGVMNLQQFFQMIATYCMYSQEDILRFAFTTFDKDSSGTIDEEEFMDLCKTINNANPTFPANFKRALEEFDRNDDGLIDYDEFKLINRRYPMVLYPAFQIQANMQRNVMGMSFWSNKMRQKRLEEQILEYQTSHGGALPPVPLSTQICNALTCCCRTRLKVRTDIYEAPVKRTPKKRRKKKTNKVSDSGGGRSKRHGGAAKKTSD